MQTENYSFNRSKIIQGDCLEKMKDLPDDSVDMILADLPYGTTACKWDSIIPLEPLWKQYKRIIKTNGAIVLTASQPFTSTLVMSNPKMFKYEWIWDKINATGHLQARRMPMKRHENILVFFNGGGSWYNPQNLKYYGKTTKRGSNGENYLPSGKSNFQKYTNFPRSILKYKLESNRKHPTQKPIALFEYLIKTYTNEDDLVLDNVAGSGTTGEACINSNRDFILMEKDPKYYQVIKDRLAKVLKERNVDINSLIRVNKKCFTL